MKSLSAALSAAYGAPVQTPGLLVQIAFPTVVHWSSFADLTWNGQLWTKEDVTVENLQVGALKVAGQLRIGNGDGVAAAMVLDQGAQDRLVSLWGYDAGATALGDPVWLANAACGAVQIQPDAVRIDLRDPTEYTLGPRTFVSAAEFSPLLPAGTVLKINGQTLTLARKS